MVQVTLQCVNRKLIRMMLLMDEEIDEESISMFSSPRWAAVRWGISWKSPSSSSDKVPRTWHRRLREVGSPFRPFGSLRQSGSRRTWNRTSWFFKIWITLGRENFSTAKCLHVQMAVVVLSVHDDNQVRVDVQREAQTSSYNSYLDGSWIEQLLDDSPVVCAEAFVHVCDALR